MTRSRRVLVVDDNRVVAETVATLVRILGHSCACAFDGATALQLAAEYKPQVILLDLRMPGMDGFAVARELRQRGIEAKIIAITGFGESVFEQKPQDVGFDAVLTKPATADQISAILDDRPSRLAQTRWPMQREPLAAGNKSR